MKHLLTFSLLMIICSQPAHAAERIPVTLDRVIDGDTMSVKQHGHKKTIRLLLVDTPESKKPNTPVQPYSLEAADFTKSLVSNCNLSIEHDSKGRYDRYKRELVYLYCDDKMVNETLVREGYARVGYVYQQKDYLTELQEAERQAKSKKLRIWSMDGFVNEDGEGFNSTEEERKKEVDIIEQLRQILYDLADELLDSVLKKMGL